MPKILTQAQVEQYRVEGCTFPVRVFSEGQAASYLAQLDRDAEKEGESYHKLIRRKPHLVFKWVDELVHHPTVLDAVEDLIGPNILLYNLATWLKKSNDGSYVGWHQDSTYFPLDPPVQVTAWIAFTESNRENGCVDYVAGSHAIGQLQHADELGGKSMLGSGQHIVEAFDSRDTRSITLSPGEMSLHHTRLLHKSEPNNSGRRRIGFGISYIPTHVRCTGSVRHTAMLVRGKDDYHHFDLEPRVRFDRDPDVEPFRQDALARYEQARAEQARKHQAGAAAT